MRTNGKFLLWIIPIVLIGYSFYSEKKPCEQPITYEIGTIDARFGVTQNEFLKDINEAGAIWGNSISRELFKYDPKGSLTINLIYDTRQQTTQKERVLTSTIDKTNQVAASVKEEYTSLQRDYTVAHKEYADRLASFNTAQEAYNSEVDYWNDQGGAPSKEYYALQEKKNALMEQRNSLEERRRQVNQAADDVNTLIDRYNLLVDHINTNVEAINNDGLAGTTFEQGEYISDDSGERINIYQFDTQTYFIRVLAHEMGHALGLEHNDTTDSIMNPINQSQSLVLSSNDLQALKSECGL